MNNVRRIAFAMWKTTVPADLADGLTPENLGVVPVTTGDGSIGERDLSWDWQLNRNSYRVLATAAIKEMQAIIDERGGQVS